MTITNYQNLLNLAYGKYQLHWMADHGYSLTNLIEGLNNYMKDAKTSDLTKAFSHWEKDNDLGGSIYASKEEFEEVEFQDTDYMRNLLNKDEFRMWCSYDAVFLLRHGNHALTADDIKEILTMLPENHEYDCLEVADNNLDIVAIGFITTNAYAELGYNKANLDDAIRKILSEEKETETDNIFFVPTSMDSIGKYPNTSLTFYISEKLPSQTTKKSRQ